MSDEGRTRINPSLIIGLGGQGQRSLLEVRRRLLQTYNKVPPQVRLLSVDTDNPEDEVAKTLNADEFVKIEAMRVQQVVESNADQLDPWMDLDRIPFQTIVNIDEGAGQIRQLGRFTLQANMAKVLDPVKKALKEIRDWKISDSDEFYSDDRSPRQIVFVGSMAGGTGSGTLLDLACAVQALPEAADWKRYAYLVMPGVFRGISHAYYVEENSYAFLKELDLFTNEGHKIHRGDYGNVFDVSLGATEYQMRTPFTHVLLVDSTNRGGVTFDTPQALAEATAIAVFTTLGGAIGGKVASVLKNPGNGTESWNGMRCLYSTFGVTELYFPREEYAEYGEALLVERLVDQMELGQAAEEAEQDVERWFEDFLQRNGLKELGAESNQIVDSIHQPKAFKPQIPKDLRKEADVEEVWQKNAHEMSVYQERVSSESGVKRTEMLARVTALIGDEVERFLRERGGTHALNFVQKFAGEMTSVRDELAVEGSAAKAESERLAGLATGAKATCVSATKKMFNRRDAVATILRNYSEALKIQARQYALYRRALEGQALCESVIVLLTKLEQKLHAQQSTVGRLKRHAADGSQTARMGVAKPSAFRVPVEPDMEHMKLPDVSARDFYGWLREESGVDALKFWDGNVDDVYRSLMSYVRDKEMAKSLRGGSLTKVLQEKSDPARQLYLDRVAQRSEPLISYRDGAAPLNMKEEQTPTSMYKVGAPEEFFGLFKDEADAKGEKRDLGRRLNKAGDFEEVIVKDPDRAYFFHYFGALPAYALEVFPLLRSEYMEKFKDDKAWTLHLDKRWDDILPDLDPEASDDEGLWVWAIASSDIDYLCSVKKAGVHYTFEYEQALPDGRMQPVTVSLGQGVDTARRAFLAKREYVAYAERRLSSAVARVGNAVVLEDLARYNDARMAEKSRLEREKDLQRAQDVQKEIDAIAEYRKKLQR